jgi:cell division septum initiation protein DivIVA
MALTRTLLKGLGLTDEQVSTIIEAHIETVDGLKADIEKYKGDAKKLPDVQKELDDLKAAGDGGYKEKYEKEHSDFEKYKADQEAKETREKKAAAYTALLKAAGVSEKRIPAILKVTDLDSVELEGDKVKDADTITESVKTEWADFIESSNTTGANTTTPPTNNPGTDKDLGSLSMEEYIAARTKQ